MVTMKGTYLGQEPATGFLERQEPDVVTKMMGKDPGSTNTNARGRSPAVYDDVNARDNPAVHDYIHGSGVSVPGKGAIRCMGRS